MRNNCVNGPRQCTRRTWSDNGVLLPMLDIDRLQCCGPRQETQQQNDSSDRNSDSSNFYYYFRELKLIMYNMLNF